MKRVAVFIQGYTIGNSPSIINLLNFLADHYRVDVYLRYVNLRSAEVLKKKNISVINVYDKGVFGHKRQKIRAFFSSYKTYIALDPHGFVLCRELFPEARPIYYSLELYMKNDHFGLTYEESVMEEERAAINSIKGLIIQSEEKERLFRQDYNLSRELPCLILPITYRGPSVKEKSEFLRTKYNIGPGKKIALHLGGIAEWYSCIEIATAFSMLHDWVLLFQGYPDKEYVDKMNAILTANAITNVIISDETYDSLEYVDPVIASSDLGIAWYNDISVGFRTAGKSSGKIPAYLRFGLPVIAKRYQSTAEALEQPGCGVCIDNVDEMRNAIEEIEANYRTYSSNALAEYEANYRFEKYEARILDFIA